MARLAMVRTPLRVSFVGGGSDIPPGPGAVISSTIDKHVYCVAKRRTDSKIYLTWREKEIVDSPSELHHELVRESFLETGMDGGVEILTFADVPGNGSGLGSSAATLISVLHALFLLRGYEDDQVDRDWLASLACQIQIVNLKKKQGFQDEYACAIGGLNRINFTAGRGGWVNVESKPIDLRPCARRQLDEHFMLFSPHSDVGRNAEDILGSYQNNVSFRTECLILASEFESILKNGMWPMVPSMLRRHHRLKCGAFSGYWTKNLEEDLGDGVGLKLCGAGGTGHLLVACGRRDRERIGNILTSSWGPPLPFRFVHYGSEVVYKED